MTDAGMSVAPWNDLPRTAPGPQALIEAGDLPWLQLEPLLRRALAIASPGSVVEVHTGDEYAIGMVNGWCETAGHALIHREPGDGFVAFWIGKSSGEQ